MSEIEPSQRSSGKQGEDGPHNRTRRLPLAGVACCVAVNVLLWLAIFSRLGLRSYQWPAFLSVLGIIAATSLWGIKRPAFAFFGAVIGGAIGTPLGIFLLLIIDAAMHGDMQWNTWLENPQAFILYGLAGAVAGAAFGVTLSIIVLLFSAFRPNH